MKHSLTLLTAATLWYAQSHYAQSYSESFEGGLIPRCVTLITSFTTTLSPGVIHDTGGLCAYPHVNNSGTRDYVSHYLTIVSSNLAIP